MDYYKSVSVTDEGVVHRLYLREALPIEDERGLAPWSIVEKI